MAKTKREETDHAAELQKNFDRWDYLKSHGGSDPFYEDGINMNLVRNHIIDDKRCIEQAMTPEQYPAVYHRETPPKVDGRYMARADEICANARKTLDAYKANPDYLFLRRRIHRLTERQKKDTSIGNVMGYVSGLDKAISEGDLVTMRRHEHASHYSDSFSSCAERVRSLKPPENEQMHLFAYLDGGRDYKECDGLDEDEDEWECGIYTNS